MNYASWLQRVGASIVDGLPPGILGVISSCAHNAALTVLVVLLDVGWWIYNRGYLAGTTGQSWGKKVLNIRLIGEQTGQPIGIGMALLRDICHFVDAIICYIGFLFPLWDDKRQTLADKIMTTVVVNV